MGSLPIGRVHLSWGLPPLLHMPLSSKRSVTGALQASDAGSSPASGTSGAFKSLELAESKYKTKNSLW